MSKNKPRAVARREQRSFTSIRLLPGLVVIAAFVAMSGPGSAQEPKAPPTAAPVKETRTGAPKGTPPNGVPGGAQEAPPKPKNLKVLPKDISHDELIGTMRGFTQGLGVRCNYCHVGEEGKPLDTYDFASDQKGTKTTARLMMKMSRDLNANWITKVKSDRPNRQVVGCITCHHGQPVPQTLDQALTAAMAEGGVAAAVQKYRDLRGKFYGRDTYDFSERPLNDMARRFIGDNRTADAIALLELNAEFNPQSSMVQVLLGEAQLKAGDKAKAAAYFQKAVDLDPKNEMAKKRLADIGGSDSVPH